MTTGWISGRRVAGRWGVVGWVLLATWWAVGRSAGESGEHCFSTLFTAQDVRDHLGTDAGRQRALGWCRETGVTKVYLETFRDGYDADGEVLVRARDEFRRAGMEVAGCVTPTSVGKRSNRWNIIGCYTDAATQDRVGVIFGRAAGMFDEIMVDDFWFTECSCGACDEARKARRVTVGGRSTEVAGDTWEAYRRELMLRMSEERVLVPARKANPRCRVIVKYPQWYDTFHERGYDVEGETRLFDRIWVGTETRDYDDKQWGGTVQYEAFFIMRWLGGLGGEKCGGGWYDWLGTTERTYVEQARQTVLGGARESMLFCYGGLQGSTGPKNVAALRREIADLRATAREVRGRKLVGVAAYKPPNSPPGGERRVFDFVGMLGIPLVPCHRFPADAPAAFFSRHALADPEFVERLNAYVGAGHPVLVTDGLAAALPMDLVRGRAGVYVLPVGGEPKGLLALGEEAVHEVRAPLLAAFGWRFRAPNRVSLCAFDDGSWVVQNFNEQAVTVEVGGRSEKVEGRGWVKVWK